MVHRLRRSSDAVLVGRKTIEMDDPSLTVRRNCAPAGGRQPLRVVLDPLLKLAGAGSSPGSDQFEVFADGLPTVVYHSVPDVDAEEAPPFPESVTCVFMPDFDLERIVRHLRDEFGVRHLMVEGGPFTARLFLPLLDRVIVVKAPLCFREPLASGITPEVLEQTGLRYLGSSECGVDTIEYWSRPDVPWPTQRLRDWP
jgi:riboflavin biosynthesis pyrimidine reductase